MLVSPKGGSPKGVSPKGASPKGPVPRGPVPEPDPRGPVPYKVVGTPYHYLVEIHLTFLHLVAAGGKNVHGGLVPRRPVPELVQRGPVPRGWSRGSVPGGPVPRGWSRGQSRGAGPVQDEGPVPYKPTFVELTRPDIYCTDRLKNLFEERCM